MYTVAGLCLNVQAMWWSSKRERGSPCKFCTSFSFSLLWTFLVSASDRLFSRKSQRNTNVRSLPDSNGPPSYTYPSAAGQGSAPALREKETERQKDPLLHFGLEEMKRSERTIVVLLCLFSCMYTRQLAVVKGTKQQSYG